MVAYFSFISVFYAESDRFRAIARNFDVIISTFLQRRKMAVDSGLIKFHPFHPSDCFWNGLNNHFPIWNFELLAEDLFALHVRKSLEACESEEYRTDRILFYLGMCKTFMKNQELRNKVSKYERRLCVFIWKNFHNPRLYAFLKLRKTSLNLLPSGLSLLSQWMQQLNIADPKEWIHFRFLEYYRDLKWFSNRVDLDRFRYRLKWLKQINRNHFGLLLGFHLSAIYLNETLITSILIDYFSFIPVLISYDLIFAVLAIFHFLLIWRSIGSLDYLLRWEKIISSGKLIQ